MFSTIAVSTEQTFDNTEIVDNVLRQKRVLQYIKMGLITTSVPDDVEIPDADDKVEDNSWTFSEKHLAEYPNLRGISWVAFLSRLQSPSSYHDKKSQKPLPVRTKNLQIFASTRRPTNT